jgi:hypothetical protein
MSNQMEEVRQYGGWRERRSFGLMGFSGVQTTVMMGLVIAVLIAGTFSTTLMMAAVPALVITGGLMLARIHGEPLIDVVMRRVSWWWAKRRGWTDYRAGRAGEPTGTMGGQMPGPLAPTVLLESIDERNQPWGVLWHRRTGYLTACIDVVSTTTWLVDGKTAENFIDRWHGWLAKLGYARSVVSVAVTVESNPAPPAALQAEVYSRLDPTAPASSRQVMIDLVENAPTASAEVHTTVAITIDPSRATIKLEHLEEQIADFSRMLTGMESGLSACGVSVAGRLDTDTIAARVRAGFDPALRNETESATGWTWADARPTAMREEWDRLRHDSGWSVSYAWDEAPRQNVMSDCLARLMSPTLYNKRVTMLFTPTPATVAARQLENEVQTTHFKATMRRKQGRDESAREQSDRELAQKASWEEARGAGLVDIQMFATVTVTDEDDLKAACADLEARSEESRIRMRRVYGSQLAGFMATLCVGINPNVLRKGR